MLDERAVVPRCYNCFGTEDLRPEQRSGESECWRCTAARLEQETNNRIAYAVRVALTWLGDKIR